MPSSPISPCPSCPPHAAGGHGCAVYSSSVDRRRVGDPRTAVACAGQHGRPRRTPEKHCRRAIVDAILYIVRGGIAWRQLPVELPPAGKRCSVDYDLQRRGALLPRFPPRPTRTRRHSASSTQRIPNPRCSGPALHPTPGRAHLRASADGCRRHFGKSTRSPFPSHS